MNPSRFFLRGFVCLDCLISWSLALRLEPAGCPLACAAVYEYVLLNIKLKIICYFLLDEVDCRLVKIQQIGDEDEIRFGLTFLLMGFL